MEKTEDSEKIPFIPVLEYVIIALVPNTDKDMLYIICKYVVRLYIIHTYVYIFCILYTYIYVYNTGMKCISCIYV